MRLSDVDVYDPDTWQSGVPFEQFAVLRRDAPVHFHSEPDGRGFWALTKHADCVAVSRDHATFSSERGGTNIWDLLPEQLEQVRFLMLNTDPPKHTKLRNIVNKGFTPRMVSRMEEHVRACAVDILDAVASEGRIDFVKRIAAELPLQVIAEIMGVPQEDRFKVFDWSNQLIGFDDPEFQTSRDDARAAATELWAYSNQLAAQRREHPTDDLISVLLEAEVDGERLTELEFDMFFLLLAVAGNETTRNLISGGMLTLFQHPDQLARLRDDLSLMPTAIEEMLRWICPVTHFRRTATRETEIRGQAIAEGEKVVIYYISANRDEDVFESPDVFDVGRTPNEHLAFGGGGAHFCLGANLARLEIRVMFEELLKRFGDIRLDGEVRRLRSNFISGIKEMPVAFKG